MILAKVLGTLLNQIRRRVRQHPGAVSRLTKEGFRLQEAGDREEALRKYAQVLARDPHDADANYLAGVVHAQCERYDIAEEYLSKALALRPDFKDAYIDLGNVHRLKGNVISAEASYRKALTLDPDDVRAHFNLAKLLKELNRQREALDYLRQGHRLVPAERDILRALVTSLLESGQYEEAIVVAERAARELPDSYEAQLCLGLAYQKSHLAAEALASYEKALGLKTDDAELHNNRGISLQELGRVEEALASYDRALELRPDFHVARFHRALADLMTGNYSRGWADYETRLLSVDRPVRPLSFPRWDGTPLTDRTLLVYGDQGLGDEIMFASCLADVMRDAGHCIVECAPKLSKLFVRSFPEATVYEWAPGRPKANVDRLRDVALEVPSSSLPLYYRRAMSDFPDHKGYLVADPRRVEYWRERMAELGPGMKIGISWRGGTYKTRSPKRSIPLDHWLPILRTPGAQFVSLQYTGGADSDLRALRDQYGVEIVHWPEAIEDYDETAALVAGLDLTISVCTAVVHLGGALGRPVWVMAPYSPEWRYGLKGARMPWYPSVRIFRQPTVGEWGPVIASVKAFLSAVAGQGAMVPSPPFVERDVL